MRAPTLGTPGQPRWTHPTAPPGCRRAAHSAAGPRHCLRAPPAPPPALRAGPGEQRRRGKRLPQVGRCRRRRRRGPAGERAAARGDLGHAHWQGVGWRPAPKSPLPAHLAAALRRAEAGPHALPAARGSATAGLQLVRSRLRAAGGRGGLAGVALFQGASVDRGKLDGARATSRKRTSVTRRRSWVRPPLRPHRILPSPARLPVQCRAAATVACGRPAAGVPEPGSRCTTAAAVPLPLQPVWSRPCTST